MSSTCAPFSRVSSLFSRQKIHIVLDCGLKQIQCPNTLVGRHHVSQSNIFGYSRILRVSETDSPQLEDKDELLKDAAKLGDMQRLIEILKSGGVDVNSQSSGRAGWTALQLAAFYEHSAVVGHLLSAGADTEVRNNSGNTALQFACLKGNVEIARILLDAGADLDASSNDKGTVMDYAQEWGGEEIVDFLLLWAAQGRIRG